MREIITQLQPGREGGRQGSAERAGRKDGGQRGRGCKGMGGGVHEHRRGLEESGAGGKGWTQRTCGWLVGGLLLESGRLYDGDNWKQLAVGQWGAVHAANCCSTSQWPGTPLATSSPALPSSPCWITAPIPSRG